MSAVTGPGGTMGPSPSWGAQPISVTDVLNAQADYSKEQSVPNAIALIDKLQELKQAAQQNPALRGAYEKALEQTKELPGGDKIVQAVEGFITPTSAAIWVTDALKVLTQMSQLLGNIQGHGVSATDMVKLQGLVNINQLLGNVQGQGVSVTDMVKLQGLVNQLSQAIGSDPNLSRIVDQMKGIIGGGTGQAPSVADFVKLQGLINQLIRAAG